MKTILSLPVVATACVVVSILTPTAHASVLAGWDFNGGDASQTSVSATTLATDIALGTTAIGPNVIKNTGDGVDRFIVNYLANNAGTTTTLDDALAAGSYISVSLSGSAGFSLSLDTFTVNLGNSNAEANYGLVSSVTGFSEANLIPFVSGSNLTAGTVRRDGTDPVPGFQTGGPGAVWANGSTYTANLGLIPALQAIAAGTTVEFRIVAFNVQNSYMFWGITNKSGSDVAVEGSVAVVPEPGAVALVGMAAAGLMLRRRRR